MIKIIAIALITTTISIIIKKTAPEYALMTQIGAAAVILFSAYPYLCDIIDFFCLTNFQNSQISSVSRQILKTVGIAVITQIASDICAQSGEKLLSEQVIFAGKVIIIASIIPFAKTIISIALELMEKI